MDREVVLNKLENLRRCVARVETKAAASLNDLIDDVDVQDIIVLNLERAVQVCVDIGLHLVSDIEVPVPDCMSETFRTLAKVEIIRPDLAEHLSKAVGFRNTAVHAYQDINWAIVYRIVHDRLDDFREYARQVLAFVER